MNADSTNIQPDVEMTDGVCTKKIKKESSPPPAQTVKKEKPDQKTTALQGRLTAVSKHDQAFLCVVCTDKASGYHYGVPACEGCKAFFKRSLQSKELNYKCPASSNCTIDKLSRKCCQACRLKKCNDVGMSKEFLGNKIKRPKTDKDKPRSRSKRSDTKDSENCVESSITAQEMELENLLRSLTAIHSELYVHSGLLFGAKTLRERFCLIIDQQLVRIIDWAKLLPGYSSLVISDQALLLQAAWVDLLVLNWVYHSSKLDDCIGLSKFFMLNFTEASELGFETVYTNLLSLASRAKKYSIDEEEISCLKAISLTNAESGNLSSLDKVTDLITTYSDALQYFTNSRHRSNPQKFAKLVLILPQLKYLVNQVMEFLYRTKMNETFEVSLSDIVVEMLEAKQRL